MADQNDKKRGRSLLEEVEVELVEVKRLREDLLESFEEDDICTTSEDLDSFMKSFEEEILQTPATVIDGESGLDLGFLLEASDDELGLPPPATTEAAVGEEEVSELVRVPAGESEGMWEFEDRVTSFETLGFGGGGMENVEVEYVALDGLFDYADLGFGPVDFGWQPETLPAL